MSNFFCNVCGGNQATTGGACARCGLAGGTRVFPSVPLPMTVKAFREEDGFGRLRVVDVPEYLPDRERLTKSLRSLSKAYAYLPGHIDGEFDNALHDVRRCIEWALKIGDEARTQLSVREAKD